MRWAIISRRFTQRPPISWHRPERSSGNDCGAHLFPQTPVAPPLPRSYPRVEVQNRLSCSCYKREVSMLAKTVMGAALGAFGIALLASPAVADIINDWNTAVAPPPPELKEVTVDPSTTALLFLDIMKGGCSARPRCIAAVPNMKRLHEAARAHNMVVWYSLVGSNGKAT